MCLFTINKRKKKRKSKLLSKAFFLLYIFKLVGIFKNCFDIVVNEIQHKIKLFVLFQNKEAGIQPEHMSDDVNFGEILWSLRVCGGLGKGGGWGKGTLLLFFFLITKLKSSLYHCLFVHYMLNLFTYLHVSKWNTDLWSLNRNIILLPIIYGIYWSLMFSILLYGIDRQFTFTME